MTEESVAAPVEPGKVELEEPPKPEGQAVSEYEKSLRREVEKYRKKWEEKVKEEESAKRKALEEQGEFKKLYEAHAAEAELLKTELEKYRSRDEKRREALLEKLPEEDRETFKTLDTDQLEIVLNRLELAKGEPTPGARPGKASTEKSFEEMTNAEKLQLKVDNPARYQAQARAWYKRVNGREPPPNYFR